MDTEPFKLVMTCSACPEQYNVLKNGEQVGYLRLRHGYFSAEVPDCGGKLVYEADTIGDGMFDNQAEREREVGKALAAIATEAARLAQAGEGG